MSEDYLWDKTGKDQEIERLENMLSVFQYQETDPPVLPTTTFVPVAEKAPRFRFSFAFAFAGPMAAVLIGFGLFWLIPREREVAVVGPQPPVATVKVPIANAPVSPEQPAQSVSSVSKNDATRPSFIKHPVPVAFKQRNVVAKAVQKKVRFEDLTQEEKYAYGQLMLALSITSSKLQAVRQTIDQIENDKTSDKPNFR